MLNIELVKKYDVAVPRYTSYPSANLFNSSFTADSFKKAIRENKNSSDISIYFHIPFCDTLCYFCACNMFITKDRNLISMYLKALKNEVSMSIDFLGHRRVSQIHFGGGTPTYLTPSEINDITDFIMKNFKVNPSGEFSFEADPRGLTYQHLKAFADAGFNRVSMGVQDFDERVQKAINRIHPFEEVKKCVDMIRDVGFKSLNLDFIYGLPFQSVKSFERTVDLMLELKPDRIALFNFAYLPELRKYHRVIRQDWLPEPHEKLSIFKMAHDKLTSNGYEFIGLDHFALPHDELFIARKNGRLQRNFQGYSTYAGLDLFAYGMSAISSFQNVYSQNYKDLKKYMEAVEAGIFPVERGYELKGEDILRRYIIMELMCNMNVRFVDVLEKFGVDFTQKFSNELKRLNEFVLDGLVKINSTGVVIKESGVYFLRNIASVFDGYLGKVKAIHSKAV